MTEALRGFFYPHPGTHYNPLQLGTELYRFCTAFVLDNALIANILRSKIQKHHFFLHEKKFFTRPLILYTINTYTIIFIYIY